MGGCKKQLPPSLKFKSNATGTRQTYLSSSFFSKQISILRINIMFKVTIIGAGNVGTTAGQYLHMRGIADLVFIDINEEMAKGKALDLSQTASISSGSAGLLGTSSYGESADSDIVVITAGIARKPNMSRDDLLSINAGIVSQAAKEAIKYSPNAIFIVVTNPLDIMTDLVQKTTQLDSKRVLGMAGVLDSARLEAFIAAHLQISPADVRAMVLGGHGDLMVPLKRHSSVKGIPVTELIEAEALHKIMERTRNGGAEIVSLLKSGSAYYAPGASVAQMVEAILLDEQRLLPCCVKASGQYGLQDIYIGLPAIVGRNGVEKIVELALNEEESRALAASAQSIADNIALLESLRQPKPQAPSETDNKEETAAEADSQKSS